MINRLKDKSGNFKTIKSAVILILSASVLTISSCNAGKLLKTTGIEDTKQIEGLYTLILFGTAEYNGLAKIAFLDLENDEYELEPFSPDFNYKISKGRQAKEAIDAALHFIRYHHDANAYKVKKITGENGKTIAYELRPLYFPFVYGYSDILDVDYWLKDDGMVKVTIDVLPVIEEMFLKREESDIFH